MTITKEVRTGNRPSSLQAVPALPLHYYRDGQGFWMAGLGPSDIGPKESLEDAQDLAHWVLTEDYAVQVEVARQFCKLAPFQDRRAITKEIRTGNGPSSRQARPLSDEIKVVQVRDDGYSAKWKHLKFIVSEEQHGGQWWIHASVSRRDRKVPTYDDLKELKRLTLGDDRSAVQVFSATDDHIDIAGPLGVEVLHLWSPPRMGNPLPDFGRHGTI